MIAPMASYAAIINAANAPHQASYLVNARNRTRPSVTQKTLAAVRAKTMMNAEKGLCVTLVSVEGAAP